MNPFRWVLDWLHQQRTKWINRNKVYPVENEQRPRIETPVAQYT